MGNKWLAWHHTREDTLWIADKTLAKHFFLHTQNIRKKKMPSLSTKERKAKWHVAIKEFNDELLNIVKIQDKMEKTYSINEQVEIDKSMRNMRVWWVNKKFRNLISKKQWWVQQRRNRVKGNKRKKSGLNAELECKQDLIMQEESETSEIFSDLYHKRLNALYELDLKGERLVKLGLSQTKNDEAKKSNNLGQSSWWWNCSF